MAENNNSAVLETEELTSYTTETNSGAGTGTSTIAPGYGTGRRKEAVARVRLVPGTGKWTINGRTLEEYFPSKLLQREVNSPIVLLKLEGKFDCIVLVDGGGTTGQAGAIRLLPDPRCPRRGAQEGRSAQGSSRSAVLEALSLIRPTQKGSNPSGLDPFSCCPRSCFVAAPLAFPDCSWTLMQVRAGTSVASLIFQGFSEGRSPGLCQSPYGADRDASREAEGAGATR